MIGKRLQVNILLILLLLTDVPAAIARNAEQQSAPQVAVGPQYDTAHVYVAPADVDRFSDSVIATFGGTKSQQAAVTVTPTPSTTNWQAVYTPVGTFSVFGFTTPLPYPFGVERTGYLVTDIDKAIQSAKANGADISWPRSRIRSGAMPSSSGLAAYICNCTGTRPHRITRNSTPYPKTGCTCRQIAPMRSSRVRAILQGKVVSDDRNAPGIEIGRPKDTYRRVRIETTFGKITVLVTNGQLPYPYGREVSGYEVANLARR